MPLSHSRRCTARCSEAAAHHDICSSGCSLPCELCLSRVGCLKPCPPHEDFRGWIEKPSSAIISSANAESGSAVAENATRTCHHFFMFDPSWGVGAEWVKVACKPALRGWPDLGEGKGRAICWSLEERQMRMARVGIPCSTGFLSDVKSSSRVRTSDEAGYRPK